MDAFQEFLTCTMLWRFWHSIHSIILIACRSQSPSCPLMIVEITTINLTICDRLGMEQQEASSVLHFRMSKFLEREM